MEEATNDSIDISSIATMSSEAKPALDGTGRAESQLRKLNARYAGWVAAQMEENPASDWSAAATEYTEFVQQIKSKWAQEQRANIESTKVHHK